MMKSVSAAARTLTWLLKVFPMLPSRPLDWVTPQPVVERMGYCTSHGETESDLYRPSTAGPHPGMVVCLGVVPFGVDHPQVPRLGEALARSGFAALLYWSPAMRVRERLSAMSPIAYLDQLRAPLIVLFHDRDDVVIPVGESRSLRDALAGKRSVRYTEFTVFKHFDPTKGTCLSPMCHLGKRTSELDQPSSLHPAWSAMYKSQRIVLQESQTSGRATNQELAQLRAANKEPSGTARAGD